MSAVIPEVARAFTYANENAEVIGQVCECVDGSIRWRTPDGDGWRDGTVPEYSLPPYRLPELIAAPGHTVLFADTEAEADALAALGFVSTVTRNLPGSSFLRWFEGRKVVYVYGRNVIEDIPGQCSTMARIAKSVRVVALDESAVTRDAILAQCKAAAEFATPEGWHAAMLASKQTALVDGVQWHYSTWVREGHPPERFTEIMLSQLERKMQLDDDEDAARFANLDAERQDIAALAYDVDDFNPLDETGERDERHKSAPFMCLGYDDGRYYYLPHRTQQLVEIGIGSQTSSAQLLGIAPLEWWEAAAPAKNGVDWTMAGNMCIRWNEQKGVFDPSSVRGRGAWFDAGRAVLHLGNRLLVDRATTALHEIESRFIYERKPNIEALDLAEELEGVEGMKLYDIARAMNWSKRIDALLFTGFLVLSPICGALTWRPHVWITARRGSGKSWAFENIVAPVVGAAALHVQASTSEAGIRQTLGQDARPVIFDEAEGESVKARQRIQEVLELARQASSDGHAEIAKGTTGGRAISYRVRSMFCLASINVGLSQASDKSRFTVLSLGTPKPGDEGVKQFERLQSLVGSTLTAAWCASLRSRTYSLIPTIRANAAVLAKAGAEVIGNQRAGDQIGALLAGAYSLKSDARISLDEARAWVSSHNWNEDKEAQDDGDEYQLCKEILHAQLRVDSPHGLKVRSVAELLQFLGMDHPDDELIDGDAHRALQRHGLKYKDDLVYVSESHPQLRELLAKSAWGGSWSKVIERVRGAKKHSGQRFAGVTHRAISVPLGEMMGAAEHEPL